jgi:hypothetical protein
MRIITVTILLMTLVLTAGVVNADLGDDCVSKCALNRRSCDDGCPPGCPSTYEVWNQCLQDCRIAFISSSYSGPPHEPTNPPSSRPSPDSLSN